MESIYKLLADPELIIFMGIVLLKPTCFSPKSISSSEVSISQYLTPFPDNDTCKSELVYESEEISIEPR